MADMLIEELDEMLRDDRRLRANIGSQGQTVVSAVPCDWPGGPIHPNWRAEGNNLREALERLLVTYRLTPASFRWEE